MWDVLYGKRCVWVCETASDAVRARRLDSKELSRSVCEEDVSVSVIVIEFCFVRLCV